MAPEHRTGVVARRFDPGRKSDRAWVRRVRAHLPAGSFRPSLSIVPLHRPPKLAAAGPRSAAFTRRWAGHPARAQRHRKAPDRRHAVGESGGGGRHVPLHPHRYDL